jgi:hypothetical protein
MINLEEIQKRAFHDDMSTSSKLSAHASMAMAINNSLKR